MSEVSVGRLLRTMGLSPQRPLWRAYQQNPDAVERWKREDFPALREQAKKYGATILFADEAGIRSDYHTGTTWAPVGKTRSCAPPAPGIRSTCSPRSPPRAACGSWSTTAR
ncbi:winged helix-turn-helix domain-containing protein [Nocardia vaccinii]|uniref:winged helix-turn-helix domain-containing protein n=1 Tax=Nocardia vaccinii TaxID=1822 RepID=UPI0035A234F2